MLNDVNEGNPVLIGNTDDKPIMNNDIVRNIQIINIKEDNTKKT